MVGIQFVLPCHRRVNSYKGELYFPILNLSLLSMCLLLGFGDVFHQAKNLHVGVYSGAVSASSLKLSIVITATERQVTVTGVEELLLYATLSHMYFGRPEPMFKVTVE